MHENQMLYTYYLTYTCFKTVSFYGTVIFHALAHYLEIRLLQNRRNSQLKDLVKVTFCKANIIEAQDNMYVAQRHRPYCVDYVIILPPQSACSVFVLIMNLANYFYLFFGT